MGALTTRKLCTFSSIFRSHLHGNVATFKASSSSSPEPNQNRLNLSGLYREHASPPAPTEKNLGFKENDNGEKGEIIIDLVQIRRQEVSRARKQRVFYKHRVDRLLKKCNAVVEWRIKTAKETENEHIVKEEMTEAIQIFKWMRERGFQL